MELPIREFISKELATLPDINVNDGYIDLLLGSKTVPELETNLSKIVDKTSTYHAQIYKSLFSSIVNENNLNLNLPAFRVYKKTDVVDAPPISKIKDGQIVIRDAKSSEDFYLNTEGENTKRKPKFVPLYSDEARAVIQIPGRHKCDCQASKHKLINNCLSCGRIVCEQEGSGPCVFCGSLVCTDKEMEVLNRNSRKSENLKKRLFGINKENSDSDALSKAIEHRDKLLNFDKSCEQRTRVIDDQADYFSSDSKWLSPTERKVLRLKEKEIREIRHAPRSQRKYKFDFAGREIKIDDEVNIEEITKKIENEYLSKCKREVTVRGLINPDVEIVPEFINIDMEDVFPVGVPKMESSLSRIQDKGLLEMIDEGKCLSMHQPYASLLVMGIKRHEGRTWYTPHRGRLWIASTSKVPNSEDIKEVEEFYTKYYSDPDIDFPKTYQSGCILGCVHVSDCLPQEEYRREYPNGESECPYVFMCENPFPIPVKMPIQGKHKIYKLDPVVHKACRELIKA